MSVSRNNAGFGFGFEMLEGRRLLAADASIGVRLDAEVTEADNDIAAQVSQVPIWGGDPATTNGGGHIAATYNGADQLTSPAANPLDGPSVAATAPAGPVWSGVGKQTNGGGQTTATFNGDLRFDDAGNSSPGGDHSLAVTAPSGPTMAGGPKNAGNGHDIAMRFDGDLAYDGGQQTTPGGGHALWQNNVDQVFCCGGLEYADAS